MSNENKTLPSRNIDSNLRPVDDKLYLGYNERKRVWIKIQYRWDSNRFFVHPYTGGFYPFYVMNKYSQLEQ